MGRGGAPARREDRAITHTFVAVISREDVVVRHPDRSRRRVVVVSLRVVSVSFSIAVINVIAFVAVIIFIIIIIVSKRSTATIIIQLWRRRARPDAVPTNILCAREEVMKKEKTAV